MTKPTEIELHAGHAVKVKGAVGHIDEFTENRRVAKRVYEILTASKVPATYYEDTQSTTQAQNINNIIKHHNADRNGLIASIHFNAGGDGSKAIGTEVIYYNQKELAAKLSKAISDATSGGLKNRGAKLRKDLGVLAKTYEPAVLIEVCFVNSSIDVAIYQRNFEKICQAIARVLAAEIGHKLGQVTPAADFDRELAIKLIRKAVKDGVFTSPHKDAAKYSDKELDKYVWIYIDRITK